MNTQNPTPAPRETDAGDVVARRLPESFLVVLAVGLVLERLADRGATCPALLLAHSRAVAC
jgi:hypothetical protein